MSSELGTFKFENRPWFFDSQKDPSGGADPVWQGYGDLTSTVIEHHWHQWQNKEIDDPVVVISDEHKVDVEKKLQILLENEKDKRVVKRGEPGARGLRPSTWRFTNTQFLGIFKAFSKWGEKDLSTASWLGNKYYKSVGKKPFSKEAVIRGIMKE